MQFNWLSLVTIIISILVIAYFIWLAIVLHQIAQNNTTTVSTGTIWALFIISIILAVIALIQGITAILAIIWPERFGFALQKEEYRVGVKRVKKGQFVAAGQPVATGTNVQYAYMQPAGQAVAGQAIAGQAIAGQAVATQPVVNAASLGQAGSVYYPPTVGQTGVVYR